MIGRLYWEALEYSLRNPVKESDLTDREKQFSSRFSVTVSIGTLMTYFGLARRLKERIWEEARKAGKARVIKSMLDVNLLEL